MYLLCFYTGNYLIQKKHLVQSGMLRNFLGGAFEKNFKIESNFFYFLFNCTVSRKTTEGGAISNKNSVSLQAKKSP